MPADCEAFWAAFEADRYFRSINKRTDLSEEDKARLKDLYIHTKKTASERLAAAERTEELRLRQELAQREGANVPKRNQAWRPSPLIERELKKRGKL